MIKFTATALAELRRLHQQQLQCPKGILRLGITSGGCAGLAYEMKFVSQPQPNDALWESAGMPVAIAAGVMPLLAGLTIDYSEDLMGGSFRFNNPNATATCSCGHSFSVN